MQFAKCYLDLLRCSISSFSLAMTGSDRGYVGGKRNNCIFQLLAVKDNSSLAVPVHLLTDSTHGL